MKGKQIDIMAAAVCAVLLTGLYRLCLAAGVGEAEFPWTDSVIPLRFVMRLLIYMVPAAAVGWAAGRLSVRMRTLKAERTWFAVLLPVCVPTVCALLVWVVLCYAFGMHSFLWMLRSLLVVLWPAGVGAAGVLLAERTRKTGRLQAAAVACAYFVLAGLLILVLTDWMARYVILKREPFLMVYLLLTAAGAFLYGLFRKGKKEHWPGCLAAALLSFGLVLFLLLFRQERVRQILDNLGICPVGTGMARETADWAAFRMEALWANMTGDFSGIAGSFPYGFQESCPLSYMNLRIGPAAVLMVVLLMSLLVFFCFRLTARRGDENGAVRGMMFSVSLSFAVKTLIGLGTEAFLIRSSSVGIPLLSNAADVVPLVLLLVLACLPEEQS